MSRYVLVEMPMPECCPCELSHPSDGWHDLPCFASQGIKGRKAARWKEFDECVANHTRPDWCPIKGEIQDNSIISISEGQIGYPVMQRDPRDFLNGRITGISNVKL